jgi:hypothetical protein
MLAQDMSRNKCFFLLQILHVLHFISISDLFTDSPLCVSILKLWFKIFQQEKIIKELQEKCQQSLRLHQSELETLRSRLTVERHERQKEQSDHGVMIRWDTLVQNDHGIMIRWAVLLQIDHGIMIRWDMLLQNDHGIMIRWDVLLQNERT